MHRTLSPAAGAFGTLLVGIREADAGRQRRLVRFFSFRSVREASERNQPEVGWWVYPIYDAALTGEE